MMTRALHLVFGAVPDGVFQALTNGRSVPA
ncbi:hypothetical protein SAMN05661107_0920 [Maritimibacter sp. HL-12]|nr:hypothetical protein SAMN05661107_0920 [Maritimibacter sp. HL-12]